MTSFKPALTCTSDMELGTQGKEIYSDFRLALWYNPDETFEPKEGATQRLSIVLIKQGTGILTIGGSRQIFLAPALFCLNPYEDVVLEQSRDLKAQSLYYYSGVVNSVFTMENIQGASDLFEGTAFQDFHLLKPFIHRATHYSGQIVVDAASIRRITMLFLSISTELSQQSDWYWPCRSRSYLIETLFMLHNLYNTPRRLDSSDIDNPLIDSSDEFDALILFLHAHYHEKLSISTLSRQFNTNRTSLEERFNKATGSPIMAYLTRLRLRIATSILHDTTIPVLEVAQRVGFGDATHFGRTFRKYIGCSPMEYRQRYCWV